jgi:mRNA-degrading endonuclease RelE of RelBE toxin-antitoxin system
VWTVKLLQRAARQLDDLPDRAREECLDLIDDLRHGEFWSDTVPLRGHRNFERTRFGSYRTIYRVNRRAKTVLITKIVKRDEKTYSGFNPEET